MESYNLDKEIDISKRSTYLTDKSKCITVAAMADYCEKMIEHDVSEAELWMSCLYNVTSLGDNFKVLPFIPPCGDVTGQVLYVHDLNLDILFPFWFVNLMTSEDGVLTIKGDDFNMAKRLRVLYDTTSLLCIGKNDIEIPITHDFYKFFERTSASLRDYMLVFLHLFFDIGDGANHASIMERTDLKLDNACLNIYNGKTPKMKRDAITYSTLCLVRYFKIDFLVHTTWTDYALVNNLYHKQINEEAYYVTNESLSPGIIHVNGYPKRTYTCMKCYNSHFFDNVFIEDSIHGLFSTYRVTIGSDVIRYKSLDVDEAMIRMSTYYYGSLYHDVHDHGDVSSYSWHLIATKTKIDSVNEKGDLSLVTTSDIYNVREDVNKDVTLIHRIMSSRKCKEYTTIPFHYEPTLLSDDSVYIAPSQAPYRIDKKSRDALLYRIKGSNFKRYDFSQGAALLDSFKDIYYPFKTESVYEELREDLGVFTSWFYVIRLILKKMFFLDDFVIRDLIESVPVSADVVRKYYTMFLYYFPNVCIMYRNRFRMEWNYKSVKSIFSNLIHDKLVHQVVYDGRLYYDVTDSFRKIVRYMDCMHCKRNIQKYAFVALDGDDSVNDSRVTRWLDFIITAGVDAFYDKTKLNGTDDGNKDYYYISPSNNVYCKQCFLDNFPLTANRFSIDSDGNKYDIISGVYYPIEKYKFSACVIATNS